MKNLKFKVAATVAAFAPALASLAEDGSGSSSTIPSADFSGIIADLTSWVTSFLPTALGVLGVGLGIGLAVWGARILVRFLKSGGK